MDFRAASDAASRTLGVYMVPRVQAADWQDLEKAIKDAVRIQVAGIPWLPSGWLESVDALYAAWPDMRIMPIPALAPGGKPLPNLPEWMDSDDKRKAWKAGFDKINAGVTEYANGRLREGRRLMEEANNRAWWADKVYVVVKAIADAPATVVGAAGDFASGLLGTFLGRFWFVLVVVGVGAVLWFGRRQIGEAAASRVASTIKGKG